MTTDAAGQPGSRRSPIKRFWPLALLAAGFAAFFLFGLDDYLTYQTLVENRDWLQRQVSEHSALSFVAYVIVYGAAVAFSLPVGTVMTLAGGFLFGTLLGD